MASELESGLGLQDTGQGQEVARWFQCWKNLTGFILSVYNTGATDMKMDGFWSWGKIIF